MWILQEAASLPDQLGIAANYIKSLQINLEKLKQKKNWLTGEGKSSSSTMGGLKSPDIEIHVTGSAMEVALVTGLDCQFMFSEIIRMFHEEGAEVVNASFCIQDNTVFHTIHSKLGETSAPKDEAARISERLKKFVYSSFVRFIRPSSKTHIFPKMELLALTGASLISTWLEMSEIPLPVKPPTPPPAKPPSPPLVKPPSHPPVKPPSHPPAKPPSHPPAKPPSHPPAKPPSPPPVKPPSHPPIRKAVAVQGVVYCKSCKYRGIGTLLGAFSTCWGRGKATVQQYQVGTSRTNQDRQEWLFLLQAIEADNSCIPQVQDFSDFITVGYMQRPNQSGQRSQWCHLDSQPQATS
ncbi:BHLH domain-containing protein [Abeliophyllum distichum]|uniref:BHLH domain-containing protein n=1 Tax=Abeliophyllum distichum TaxID=126358 RepID=A0ABD1UGU9_9LAMI